MRFLWSVRIAELKYLGFKNLQGSILRMQVLIVEIGGEASPLTEADLSYLLSFAIKQVIWKQNFPSSKFHNREMVATVAKKC